MTIYAERDDWDSGVNPYEPESARARLETFQRVVYNKGWNDCKKMILEILSKPIQNADLSWDECDSRYIDKIHEEFGK